jgi:hypothetical protein
MQRFVATALTTLATVGALATVAPEAQARTKPDGFTHSASSVAKQIACKRFHGTGNGAFTKSSGVCWLAGKRVNVITFKNGDQQYDWWDVASEAFSERFYWAWGRGIIVVARNGNLPAARAGARRIHGHVESGFCTEYCQD